MASPNKLTLPLADDAELREYFSAKEPGDPCTLLIDAIVDDQIGNSVTLSVKHVEVQDYEEEPEPMAEEEEETGAKEATTASDAYYEPTTVPPEPIKKRASNRSSANVAFAYGGSSSEQPSL